MRIRFLAAAAALALGALQGTATQAQSFQADDDMIGPQATSVVQVPRVTGRGWTLGASVRSIYDTNLRRAPEGLERAAGRITPTVSGGVGLPLGGQQLFIGGTFGRDFIIDEPRLPSRNRFLVGGGADWRLGRRCSGEIGAQYGEQLVVAPDTILLLDNTIAREGYGLSATCQVGGRFSVSGGARRDAARNSNDRRSAFNLRTDSFNGALAYGTPTLGQFSVSASLADTTFTSRDVLTPTGPEPDSVHILNLRGGYSRGLGSRLTVAAGVSWIRVTPQPSSAILLLELGPPAPPNTFLPVLVSRDGFSGLGYDLTLGLRPNSRMNLNISARRQANVTPNAGALYNVNTILAGDLSYRINPAISLGVGSTYLMNRFRGAFSTGTEPLRRISDDLWRPYLQIRYAPRQLYTLGLEVAHQQRRSNPSTFNFESTSVILSLNVNLGRNR